jgi:HEAT repeat protein
MAAAQKLHPTAAMLLPYEDRLKDDMSYFRKLGVKYEADALIDLLKREKPKSAMPVACHSLADLNAKHAVPTLKTLADYPVEDVKATSVLAVARLAGSDETPWLVECLSRKGTLKGYVLWALAAVGDPAAYGAVTTWFEKHLRKLERNPTGDSLGNVVFAVAYLEQMTEHHPEVMGLLDRFKVVAPKLPGNVRSELGHFTRMFADGKDKLGPRESDA